MNVLYFIFNFRYKIFKVPNKISGIVWDSLKKLNHCHSLELSRESSDRKMFDASKIYKRRYEGNHFQCCKIENEFLGERGDSI